MGDGEGISRALMEAAGLPLHSAEWIEELNPMAKATAKQ
jgi:hypothetical protein